MINIKSIWESHKPIGDFFIKSRIIEIPQLHCFAATNHITGQHLYIMIVSDVVTIPELKNYRFKGVEFYNLHNEVDGKNEFYIYLLDNDLKDIFSLFIQNILEDIVFCETEIHAITKTFSVISKWKKLFDKINFNGLSLELQKGLIGELLFLKFLLNNNNTFKNAVINWSSSDIEFQAKDFIIGSVGIEIKFTTSKQPRVKVSNERQLDSENLNSLFLVLYSSEAVKENGFSLNSLVSEIRKIISNDEDLNIFNVKLKLNGYFDEDKEYYDSMYSIKDTYTFSVCNDFPKIIKNQLPLGVFNISYSIELSAIEKYIIDMNDIFKNI